MPAQKFTCCPQMMMSLHDLVILVSSKWLFHSLSCLLTDKQHEMFKEVMGKYPPPIYEVLADDTPGEVKTCLDLGCGSGSW